MQFLFPTFLTALAVIAVPIIVHLFFFRRFKKVHFTNVRFLREVKEETANRQKLRNLMVLLMRCLAIAAMVLAFAQPFLPQGEGVKKGAKSVSVFIDNSQSMAALSSASSLLEVAKQRAREIVSAYSAEDRFQILTQDFEGRHQRLVSKDDALNLIEDVRQSPVSRSFSLVLQRQAQCLATGKAENRQAFLLSDFQKNVSDLAAFRDSTIDVRLLPMRSVQEKNVSIDSAWFESPVQMLNLTSTLFVKMSNRSPEAVSDVRLALRHDGQTKPVGSVSILANSSVVDTVAFTVLHGGWHEAKLSLTDYPVQFDDDFYLNFYVPEKIRVLSIQENQSNRFVKNAFSGAKQFELKAANARAINYAAFAENQLIVLEDVASISSGLASELQRFATEGGHVVVFPPEFADLTSYRAFFQAIGAGELGAFEKAERQVASFNNDEFTFKDVFLNRSQNLRLPSTTGAFRLAQGRGEAILTYRDGSPFLTKCPTGEGAIFVAAAPLDEKWSNLTRSAEIFVPMLFKMAIAGQKGQTVANVIGKDAVLEARHAPTASGKESIYKLKGVAETQGADQNAAEFIPEQRILGSKVLLTPGKQVDKAGWYRLFLQKDSTLAEFAFNFDRRESDLACFSEADLVAQNLPENFKILDPKAEANLTDVVGEQNQGIVLWRWCVIFALLFLLLEAMFLRLWK